MIQQKQSCYHHPSSGKHLFHSPKTLIMLTLPQNPLQSLFFAIISCQSHPFFLEDRCVLLINCYLQKQMDYRILQIQSNPEIKFVNTPDQYTVLENASQQQSSLQDFNTKSTKWTCQQKQSFIKYWIHHFLQLPLEFCSFSAPLSRKSHFHQVCDFIKNELGQQFYKSPEQCKSRFSVIRRRVLRQRSKGKKPNNYDFLDHVIDEARVFCRKSTSSQEWEQMTGLLLRLQSLSAQEGQFMQVSRQMKAFQSGWNIELKNNQIFKYLMQNQKELPELQ